MIPSAPCHSCLPSSLQLFRCSAPCNSTSLLTRQPQQQTPRTLPLFTGTVEARAHVHGNRCRSCWRPAPNLRINAPHHSQPPSSPQPSTMQLLSIPLSSQHNNTIQSPPEQHRLISLCAETQQRSRTYVAIVRCPSTLIHIAAFEGPHGVDA